MNYRIFKALKYLLQNVKIKLTENSLQVLNILQLWKIRESLWKIVDTFVILWWKFVSFKGFLLHF